MSSDRPDSKESSKIQAMLLATTTMEHNQRLYRVFTNEVGMMCIAARGLAKVIQCLAIESDPGKPRCSVDFGDGMTGMETQE